jgi:crotonobetainyl-CoA:carnitine CoA-transferase CaiB-like acyl-CoA transferase
VSEVDPSELPLNGVRVLDLSRDLAGPFCAQLLADLGADVIKVEHPREPDEMRKWPPLANDLSTYFIVANRGKRCVTIDLAQTRGQELLWELVRRSDLVVENFRLGVAEKLGVDHARLAAANPKVVVCSIRGFGPGPREREPAYDAVIQAYSGLMSLTGAVDGEVARIGVAISDLATALFAANACQAWLLRAARTGKGGHLEVSLYGSALALLCYQLTTYLETGQEITRAGTTHPALSPVKAFATATEDVLIIGGHERHWRSLCTLMEKPEWAEDPRFATNIDRVRNRAELHELMEPVLRARPLEAWLALLTKHGVPHAPVRSIAEVAADPTVRATMIATARGTGGATFDLVRSPIRLDGRSLPLGGGPPGHGEHTDDVLRELGYATDTVTDLRSAGVI